MTAKPTVGIALTPAAFDPSGLARRLAYNYGAAFARLGYEPLYVDLGRIDDQAVGRLLMPDVRLLFNHGGWLFSDRLTLSADCQARLRATETPCLVLIADPPFYPWLVRLMPRLPPRAMPFYIDPGFAAWAPRRPSAPYLPCGDTLGEHVPVATRDKTLPAVFIGSVRNDAPILAAIRDYWPVTPALLEIIDALVWDTATPLLTALRPILGMVPERLRQMHLLFDVDVIIRQRRRQAMLCRLADRDVHIFADGLEGLPRDARATLRPPVPFTGMLEVLRQARILYVCPPNYPGAVNERIIFAMQARCLVVSLPTPRTQQIFHHGRDLFLTAPDQSDLLELDALARDDAVAEPMRDAALDRVSRGFTPDGNLRYMLGRMHAAGLLAEPPPPGPPLDVPPLRL